MELLSLCLDFKDTHSLEAVILPKLSILTLSISFNTLKILMGVSQKMGKKTNYWNVKRVELRANGNAQVVRITRLDYTVTLLLHDIWLS